MTTPVLHLLAGPNGSGKSTFAERVLVPSTGLPFVNADVIAAREWPGAELEHAYEASRLAAAERGRLLAERSSYVTETVFSHPSKVDLVRAADAAGYLVHLHVTLVPVALSVARVSERVRRGGHDVPEAKIRERHARLWPLVVAAREVADRTTCYDNSRAADPFAEVARFEEGRLVGEAHWPAWTPTELT
ncbi:AAA family ATPase [Nocardioides sp.]|uniref:AAA family ATPase n=1 Tax=Nocardioides sp. TaxID=35761 RepID=UPI002725F02A|nr:AAA family ATPase [Nocardioides sp.]MDO9454522.1 zeta toxin family protein [Nocardioides sp.]